MFYVLARPCPPSDGPENSAFDRLSEAPTTPSRADATLPGGPHGDSLAPCPPPLPTLAPTTQPLSPGLRFVEARRPTGRRFGAEADARWKNFAGDLTTSDRLDLLLRDADAEWPAAFGARTVFAEPAVAEDDAFGPAWSPLDPVDAEDLWRAGLATEPRDLDGVLAAWSAAWALPLTPMPAPVLTTVDRLVVAGPSAIAASVRAFLGRSDLAWSEQVTVVATPPAHRQLAALAAAALNAARPTRLFAHNRAAIAGGLVGRVLVSKDAAPDDAGVAQMAAS